MDDMNNYNNNSDNNGYNGGNSYNAPNNGYDNTNNGYGNQYNNGNQYNSGSQYNNGYNPFTGGYNGNPQNMYNNDDMPVQKGSGFAVASFVIALVNMILCCTCLSVVTVPLCLIFSLVTLVGKRRGKGFAIAGIVISVISAIFFAYYGYIVYKIAPDFVYFAENQNQIIEEYDRDGTIPERFEKYRDPKYDKYWDRMGYDSFDEFFAKFIEDQKKNRNNEEYYENDQKKDRNTAWYSGNAPVTVV